MKLIVRGADYAMTDSITDGCLRAARCGILTDVGPVPYTHLTLPTSERV